MNEKVNLLIQKIKSAKSILLFGHKNPDGDSLGATLALYALIRDNFAIDVTAAYDGNLPIHLDFLPGRRDIWYAEKLLPAPVTETKIFNDSLSSQLAGLLDKESEPQNPEPRIPVYDLMICLDMGSRNQFGNIGLQFLENAKDVIKIDHHKTMDWSADLEFVDICASSACEIIYEIAKAADWKINPDAAVCLCTGIYTDTGQFAYTDNNNKPFLIAADLVALGANMREISEGIKISTRADVMAQAEVLAAAEFFFEGRLAVATIQNKNYKKLDSGATEIVLFLRNIKGVECVVILKEAHTKGDIGLSIRSRSINIRPIAEKFGGGGHDLAAGGKIPMKLMDAKKAIIEEFKGVF